MKFDKETVIVLLICGVLLVLWYTYYPSFTSSQGELLPGQTATPPVQIAEKPAAPEAEKAVPSVSVPQEDVPAPQAKQRSVLTLSNGTVEYSFDSDGILSDITFLTLQKTDKKSAITLQEPAGQEPFRLSIPGYKPVSASLKKISSLRAEITRIYEGTDGKSRFSVVQTFDLAPETPALKCSMSFSGASQLVLPQVVVWNGTMPPIKLFSGDEVYRDVHTVEYLRMGQSKPESADPSVSKEEKFQKNRTDDRIQWTASANKYFVSLLSAEKPFDGNMLVRTPAVGPDGKSVWIPGQGGIIRNLVIPSACEFRFYAGKKEKAQMADMPENTTSVIRLAYWSWLEPLCGPMLKLLNFLKRLTGSYGLAIILLTVIVKLVLWPLIHRGNKSMRKLQKVQPQVKTLKEKYKDNPQLFNQKMMELYKKEGVNPMGGCFPMLLQFPVFVALYSTLDSAVELHHQSFLWATDLTCPDTVGPLIFGVGIHPLMILSTLLMILQMKLTPQGGDPTQQKMMMIMPLIMLFFFYSFPSGLTLYWCVNNILSILQMKYTQYAAKKEDEKAAAH